MAAPWQGLDIAKIHRTRQPQSQRCVIRL